MQERKDRRTNRFVDPPTQKRIVFELAMVPMSVLLVAAVLMWISAERLFDEAEGSDAMMPSLGFATLAQFLFVVVAGCFILLQAMRYSQRVAGPAHRIVQSLRQVRSGDTGLRIRLRGRDELTAVAEEINVLLDWMQQHQPTGVSSEPAAAGELGSSETSECSEPAIAVAARPSSESHDD